MSILKGIAEYSICRLTYEHLEVALQTEKPAIDYIGMYLRTLDRNPAGRAMLKAEIGREYTRLTEKARKIYDDSQNHKRLKGRTVDKDEYAGLEKLCQSFGLTVEKMNIYPPEEPPYFRIERQNITAIKIENRRINTVLKCLTIPAQLAQLTRVELIGCGISGITISQSKRLSYIDLAGNDLTRLDLYGSLPNLTHLDVEGNDDLRLRLPDHISGLNYINVKNTKTGWIDYFRLKRKARTVDR